MKTRLLLLFVFTLANRLTSQTYPNKIGVVLSSIGSPALEFPNVLPTAAKWESVANSGQNAAVDANGWPTEDFRVLFFDHRPFNAWNDAPDDTSRYVVDVSGTYTLSFKGQANLTSWCDGPVQFLNKKYVASTNTTTLDIVFPKGGGTNWIKRGNYSFFMINFLQTDFNGTQKGVKEIKLFRPNYVHNTPQIFNTDFVNGLNPFASIRYMDFMGVANNNNPIYPGITKWEDRVLPTWPQFGKGAPWEYLITLANLTNRDVWVNLPCAADSSYIVTLAKLLKKELRPNIKIYLEYSNEVWNAGDFSQYQYNYSAVLNSAEDADIRTATPWDDRRRARRVARQVIKAGKIFSQVFGETVASKGRIRPVFAWQGAYLPWFDDVLDWVNTAYGAPKNYLYAISVAPYFSPADSITKKSNATPKEIVNSMQKVCDSSTIKIIQHLAKLANKYSILQVGYESGPGTNGAGDMLNLNAKIKANNIPEIKDMIKHNYISNWFSQNANSTAPQGTNDLINYFSYLGKPSRYGCWGALEDLSGIKTETYPYKYQAICELTGRCSNRPVISITNLSQLQNINTNSSIKTTASDPNGTVKYVEFFVQNKLVAIDSAAPFELNHTFTDTGLNFIQAKAIDNEGNFKLSEGVNVNVNSRFSRNQPIALENQIKIIPNPSFTKIFTVSPAPDAALLNYRIYDVQGKVVAEQKLAFSAAFEIDLAAFNSGIYYLELTGVSSAARFKLVSM